MPYLTPLLPALSAVLLEFIAILPWGTSPTMHFFLPLLPLLAIQYWAMRQPRFMRVMFVFICGLVMDALTSGPLGIWSLVYLIGFAMALLARDTGLARFATGRWLLFACGTAVVMLCEWGVSSLYFARVLEWQGLSVAAGLIVLAYPLFAAAVWPINRLWSRRLLGPLTRGAL